MSDDILDLLSGRGGARREAKGTSSSSSYFASKYMSTSINHSGNSLSSSTTSNGVRQLSNRDPTSGYNESTDAPLDLMNKFLLCITENRMRDALDLCDQILEFEPTNKIILEYKPALKEYISQGLDQEEKMEVEEDDEDDDEEEGEEEDDDGDGEESDHENEGKRAYNNSSRK